MHLHDAGGILAKIFISYTHQDRDWAHWIGVTLRRNGHKPLVHEWEIGAGENIPLWMDEQIKAADRLLGVFTDAYTKAIYSGAERAAAFWEDPQGNRGFLVPVEVKPVTDWPPLTAPLKRLSLVGMNETEAETALLAFLEPPKALDERPAFPGGDSPAGGAQAGLEGTSALQVDAIVHPSEQLPDQRPPLPVSVPVTGLNVSTALGEISTQIDTAETEPDFLDGHALERWLKTQPRDWLIVLAARAALRVVPFLIQVSRRVASNTLLPMLRALALARISAGYQSARYDFGNIMVFSDAAFSAVNAAADASQNATWAVAANVSLTAADAAYAAANFDVQAAANVIIATAADANFRKAIHEDVSALTGGTLPDHLMRVPLWLTKGRLASEVRKDWQRLVYDLRTIDKSWEVWIDWYENLLAGRSPAWMGLNNMAWEAAFTDLPAQLPWDDGPEAVNLAIKDRLAALIAPGKSTVSDQNQPQLHKVEVATGVPFEAVIQQSLILPKVPDQSPAPVRVEERGGKIASVHDRDSPLRADERDFNAWREPVIDHIKELISGDFCEGTNHSRARDRLFALGNLLPGDIAEVKEQQFRIGYEIERFEGLIVAYRSGGEDMPALNAAVLEDLDRLRISLRMGVDKIERWAEFRHLASDNPLREADASPEAVGDALEQMAEKMERQPKYFDPELPASFRFIAEAVNDRVGATKTVVYGAVKSAENLISFLGQLALGIGKSAGEGVKKHVSKAVAATLLASLSGAALQLSGALPHAWAWLKPLLDVLAKVAG